MFDQNSGLSADAQSLGNMSKSDILRGIITEKLSTAAREILAVVERTVADYEEEASGFRREIERQRSQLELLQPHIRLERRDMHSHQVAPVRKEEDERQELTQQTGLHSHQVAPVRKEEDEQQELAQQTGAEASRPSGLVCDNSEDNEEYEGEQLLDQTTASSRLEHDDPDYKVSSRSVLPRSQSERKRPGRPRTSDLQNHLNLKVRLLEDARIQRLSNTVFRKSPVQDLRCPRGLQESDFLDLLRSTLPQLAAGLPFDVLTTDRSRRLHPLKVETLTPEEILKTSRFSRTTGNSTFYIRLKAANEPQSNGEDSCPPQDQDDSAGCSSAMTSANQTDENTKDKSNKRKLGRSRSREDPAFHNLRICFLEDTQSNAPSESVLQRSSVQDLECPRGLQEDDFVNMLRSAFPQLAGDHRRFDVFKFTRNRRLQRLKLKTLTPDEIYRTTKFTVFKKTVLYIKAKMGEEQMEEEGEEEEEEKEEEKEEEEEEEKHDASLADLGKNDKSEGQTSPSSVHHETRSREDNESSSTSPRKHDLEMEQDKAESEEDSIGEGDTGELVGGDEDWEPDPAAQMPKRTKKRDVQGGVETSEDVRMSCQVCAVWYRNLGSLIKHAWSHLEEAAGVCGVCGESFVLPDELKEHLRNHQTLHSCSECGKMFTSVSGLNYHVALHTGSSFKCNICGKAFTNMSGLNYHRWVHVEDKLYKCEVCHKSFGNKVHFEAHLKTHSRRDRYHCNVCGKTVNNRRSLAFHKMTHSKEWPYSCDVCGKRFKQPKALKKHVIVHTERDRPFLCHICSKTFHSNSVLKAHLKTHGSERPFVCDMCGKGFRDKRDLKKHIRVHTGEAPFGCSDCGRCFKQKAALDSHVRGHLGIKRFVCGVCGKACARQEHLKVHMRTHNGERPYQCSLCEKAFTQSHCLKTHMKSHQAAETTVLDPSTS